LGANKLVAQVATQEVKDRKARLGQGLEANLDPHLSFLAVPVGTERDYLAPWPVEVLPGVGPKVRDRLERLNVRRVAQVADMPLPVLCGLFGQRGKVLRDLARGIDPRPVEPYRPPLSVSRCTSFDPPVSEHDFLLAMLDHLLERATQWLRGRRLAARRLTIDCRYGDYRSADIKASFPQATDDERQIKTVARERFARLYTRRLPLRLLGVELSPLQAPDGQAELFPDPEVERTRRLTACKDTIRERFGFLALVSGSTLVLSERLEHDRDNYRLRTPCLTR
jgi:hypothetical protein